MRHLFEKNRHPLFVFLVLFFITLVVSGLSLWNTTQAYDMYSGMKKQFNLERGKKYQAIEDTDFLLTNIAEFRSLNDRGVIGAVDRIIWVEAFEGARQRMALSEFNYDIGQPVDIAGNHGGSIALQMVTIDLRIGFPHDEALFQFFTMLEDSVNVSYAVSELQIERVSSDTARQNALSYLPVNIIATSRISWFSILPASKIEPLNVQGA